ncbi:hypothetical protein FHX44_117624 [Pseudonocardia hierapolitana]|uniref:Uncharacterized protein n=1 Tax=Pseudonocardia hierapolitana TaxID=1128676 RepID=A0A561T3J0_9PSEU|nr:hypothetical protein FHX44_117624 [Pseudonocardia hierapolitana]
MQDEVEHLEALAAPGGGGPVSLSPWTRVEPARLDGLRSHRSRQRPAAVSSSRVSSAHGRPALSFSLITETGSGQSMPRSGSS